MMKKILAYLTALTIGLAFINTTVVAATPERAKLVLQVSDDDPKKWNLALNNARNAQQDLGGPKNVDIEIVAYGPGINMLKLDALIANRVTDAIKTGISIVACENTMGAQKIDKQDMNQSISYVPAGVIQLMRRQQQGWAYVRP